MQFYTQISLSWLKTKHFWIRFYESADRVMASSSLRVVSRLVANAQKPLATGSGYGIRRNFATTRILSESKYKDTEDKRRSLYYSIWKMKYTWLIVGGTICIGLYEMFHPDKAGRRKLLQDEWTHKQGGAYDPTKPQREARPESKSEWHLRSREDLFRRSMKYFFDYLPSAGNVWIRIKSIVALIRATSSYRINHL